MLFSSLPMDIIHHILSYNEVVKLRNGKYMGQIPKTDERYELLLKIRRIFTQYVQNFYYIIYVGELLTIKISLWNNNTQTQYIYRFKNGINYSYIPYDSGLQPFSYVSSFAKPRLE